MVAGRAHWKCEEFCFGVSQALREQYLGGQMVLFIRNAFTTDYTQTAILAPATKQLLMLPFQNTVCFILVHVRVTDPILVSYT